jgi:uncharacterized surface protein with fasciclin (FAS1) repeats
MYSEELFQTFYVGVQAIYDEYMEKHYPTLKKEVFKYSEGKRYVKVIRGGSVHLFVDKTNGDVLKAALEDKAKLTSILTYHVVPGKVMAADVAKMADATTVEGSKVKINVSHGVMINESKVTKTDIECSNGVIHVIDTVLMP